MTHCLGLACCCAWFADQHTAFNGFWRAHHSEGQQVSKFSPSCFVPLGLNCCQHGFLAPSQLCFPYRHVDYVNREAQAVPRTFICCALPGWVSQTGFAAEDATVPTTPLTKTFLFIVFSCKGKYWPSALWLQKLSRTTDLCLPGWHSLDRQIWEAATNSEQWSIWACLSETLMCPLTFYVGHVGTCLCRRKDFWWASAAQWDLCPGSALTLAASFRSLQIISHSTN